MHLCWQLYAESAAGAAAPAKVRKCSNIGLVLPQIELIVQAVHELQYSVYNFVFVHKTITNTQLKNTTRHLFRIESFSGLKPDVII